MNKPLREVWSEVGSELKTFLDDEALVAVNREGMLLVREFVEHNELGLAVETLHPLALQHYGQSSTRVQTLRDLAKSMNLKLATP